jgi:hypothetical protein
MSEKHLRLGCFLQAGNCALIIMDVANLSRTLRLAETNASQLTEVIGAEIGTPDDQRGLQLRQVPHVKC